MANTDIALTTLGGAVFSDTPSFTVVSGDTFTVASSGGEAVLGFSPDLVQALSPAPSSPMTIADGQNATFTFTSSDPGGYFIAYGPAGLDLDQPFPAEISTTVYLQAPLADIIPPPLPAIPVSVGVTSLPKGGTSPTLNPQGAD